MSQSPVEKHLPIESLLIANRGEIAVRIIRACREAGIRSIAVYSEADAGALHVRLADQAVLLGPAPARESYLDIALILAAAKSTGAQAVHPGYGLLSENADFAAAVLAVGLVFVGPSPEVIAMMGDKVAARAAAVRAEVPVLPGSDGALEDLDAARGVAKAIGYPVVVKACFGGGGRGMRVVREESELQTALQDAARESNVAFGRAEIYLEHYVERGRHVEVQVLGDAYGHVVHIGDRDCSVQRRHQKMIEEAPAPDLPEDVRQQLRNAAVRLAASVGYQSAGTVEFLFDRASGKFFFLEMNTRLQVEHGVTELVSGIDLVQCQLRVAAGLPLDFVQQDVRLFGHAIQARITAEDPWSGFMPCPGPVGALRLPLGPWLRLDFATEAGDTVPGHYDSMFGKVQAWGPTRALASRRLGSALNALVVPGIQTNASYIEQVLAEPAFVGVQHDTGSVERDWRPDPTKRPVPVAAMQEPLAAEPLRAVVTERRVSLDTSNGTIEVVVPGKARKPLAEGIERAGVRRSTAAGAGRPSAAVEPVAPMEGMVARVLVQQGSTVVQGAVLVILEAMKMEMQVTAPRAGTVDAVLVQPGEVVKRGSLMVRLRDKDAA